MTDTIIWFAVLLCGLLALKHLADFIEKIATAAAEIAKSLDSPIGKNRLLKVLSGDGYSIEVQEVIDELNDYRLKLQKMHRRAQRAEAKLIHQGPEKLMRYGKRIVELKWEVSLLRLANSSYCKRVEDLQKKLSLSNEAKQSS